MLSWSGNIWQLTTIEMVEYWRESLWWQESEPELNDWLFYLDHILIHKINFMQSFTKNYNIQTTNYILPL